MSSHSSHTAGLSLIRTLIIRGWLHPGMEISIIGSGYVGTTVAACFADVGHEVVNVDVDPAVVETINDGEAPIHEDGLAELIAAHAGADGTGRLRATTDYEAVLDTAVTFLCLPTPQNADGSIDLSIMEGAAEQLGATLAAKSDWHTVVVKSTVVPGSTEEVITPILEAESEKTAGEEFGVGMYPEFLREGTAVTDFLNPHKVVLGADDDRALAAMRDVFDPLVSRGDAPVVETDTRTAEMIKYANNSFLAAKISLINDIGNICNTRSSRASTTVRPASRRVPSRAPARPSRRAGRRRDLRRHLFDRERGVRLPGSLNRGHNAPREDVVAV